MLVLSFAVPLLSTGNSTCPSHAGKQTCVNRRKRNEKARDRNVARIHPCCANCTEVSSSTHFHRCAVCNGNPERPVFSPCHRFWFLPLNHFYLIAGLSCYWQQGYKEIKPSLPSAGKGSHMVAQPCFEHSSQPDGMKLVGRMVVITSAVVKKVSHSKRLPSSPKSQICSSLH